MSTNLLNSMIVWTPDDETGDDTTARLALIPWPDVTDLQSDLDLEQSWGACNAEVQRASPKARREMLMRFVWELVLCDGIDAAHVHAVLWELDEYRQSIPPDAPAPGKSWSTATAGPQGLPAWRIAVAQTCAVLFRASQTARGGA